MQPKYVPMIKFEGWEGFSASPECWCDIAATGSELFLVDEEDFKNTILGKHDPLLIPMTTEQAEYLYRADVGTLLRDHKLFRIDFDDLPDISKKEQEKFAKELSAWFEDVNYYSLTPMEDNTQIQCKEWAKQFIKNSIENRVVETDEKLNERYLNWMHKRDIELANLDEKIEF